MSASPTPCRRLDGATHIDTISAISSPSSRTPTVPAISPSTSATHCTRPASRRRQASSVNRPSSSAVELNARGLSLSMTNRAVRYQGHSSTSSRRTLMRPSSPRTRPEVPLASTSADCGAAGARRSRQCADHLDRRGRQPEGPAVCASEPADEDAHSTSGGAGSAPGCRTVRSPRPLTALDATPVGAARRTDSSPKRIGCGSVARPRHFATGLGPGSGPFRQVTGDPDTVLAGLLRQGACNAERDLWALPSPPRACWSLCSRPSRGSTVAEAGQGYRAHRCRSSPLGRPSRASPRRPGTALAISRSAWRTAPRAGSRRAWSAEVDRSDSRRDRRFRASLRCIARRRGPRRDPRCFVLGATTCPLRGQLPIPPTRGRSTACPARSRVLVH